MKRIFISCCAFSIAILTACSSFDTATELNGVKLSTSANQESLANVNAKIWGIYVFGLPMITGSSREDGKCIAMSDTVTVNAVTSFITRQAKMKLAATTLENYTTERTSCWIPPFFSYQSVVASGNVLK